MGYLHVLQDQPKNLFKLGFDLMHASIMATLHQWLAHDISIKMANPLSDAPKCRYKDVDLQMIFICAQIFWINALWTCHLSGYL